jgi:hypothetical protein
MVVLRANTFFGALPQLRAYVNLTPAQHLLIRRAVAANELEGAVSAEQRGFVREVCAQAPIDHDREKFLIAFKVAIVEAVNELAIPYGSRRDAVVDGLISVFIAELYDTAEHSARSQMRGAVTSPARLDTKSDITSARV